MNSSIKTALIALVTISMVTTILADPRQWDPAGIPLRQGKHIAWNRQVAQDQDGNMLLVWTDGRTGRAEVYAQLISHGGVQQWTADGLRISESNQRQNDPVATWTGDGWILAWIDFRTDTVNGIVHAQKISSTGNLLWNLSGVPVEEPTNAVIHDMSVRVVPDGAGGALIAWEDNRHFPSDIFMQRILADGTRGWTSTLSVSGDSGASQSGFCAEGDGNGNMLLAWEDNRDPTDLNIYAAKVTPDGQVPWGANGLLVCGRAGEQMAVRLCHDGQSGCYLAWQDRSIGSSNDLYIQHLTGDGLPFSAAWVQNGIVLCNASRDQSNIHLTPSFNQGTPDGCFAVWEDQRVDGLINEVYAQKVLPESQMLWAANGLKVWGDAQNNVRHSCDGARVISDGSGGLVCAWEDTRNDYNCDIWASRVLANGSFAWGAAGMSVAAAIRTQFGPILVRHNTSVFVFWNDSRTGSRGLRYQNIGIIAGNPTLSPEGEEYVTGLDGDALEPQAIRMAQGRVGIVWSDNRLGMNGPLLYYQVMNADGSMERAVNGDPISPVNLSSNNANQRNHSLCTDGGGGFFVGYEDQRSDAKLIRLSHVNGLGQMDVDSQGVVVWPATRDQYEVLLCSDGSGGCYVGWHAYNANLLLYVYVMRFNTACQSQWLQPVELFSGTSDNYLKGIVSGSDHSCILIWKSGASGQWDVSSAGVNWNGTVAWTRAVCNAEGVQDAARLIEDGQGGVYCAWNDNRNIANGSDIYMQHLSASGEELWTPNGHLLISHALNQNTPTLLLDYTNHLYCFWEDFRSGTHLDLYGQKLTAGGAALWPDSGKAIVAMSGDQRHIVPQVDNDNGVYLSWIDGRSLFYSDVYATHMDSTGEIVDDSYWDPQGGGFIGMEGISSVGSEFRHGDLLLVWQRMEHYPGGKNSYPVLEIYAQRVNDGFGVQVVRNPIRSLPSRFALYQNYPNPFNPSTEITFDLPQTGQVSLKVFDILGREVTTLIHRKMTAGNYSVSFDAGKLPSGVYVYRLQSGEYSVSRKMMLVK